MDAHDMCSLPASGAMGRGRKYRHRVHHVVAAADECHELAIAATSARGRSFAPQGLKWVGYPQQGRRRKHLRPRLAGAGAAARATRRSGADADATAAKHVA
mmetsp:Transcript_93929/g.260975  ORF Transcript_93929/g.260975 Transcript_93929/m.260975 type:complete len:101 (+) Transcript_93929:61-363(+)